MAGTGTGAFYGDGGPATAAELNATWAVAVDASGNVYIADDNNQRIRKVNTSGIISTIAGIDTNGFSGDGGPATAAELDFPTGVAVDPSGNVFIADQHNNRIRKVNTSGIISTYAGIGPAGFSGDGGPATAAEFNVSAGVATDASGNVYVADFYNFRIRKINTSGKISTVAGDGTYGFSGDGRPATSAAIGSIVGVAVDVFGNIFIPDQSNGRVRKVNTSGIISTFAGNGSQNYSGDGGPATAAELQYPYGVGTDGSGNVYIADYANERIRFVNTSGIISTIAGDGTNGYYGDGGPATAAEISAITGVAPNAAGNHVFIADETNNVIRELTPIPTGISQYKIENGQLSIYPNPSSGKFTVQILNNKSHIINCKIEIYTIDGKQVDSAFTIHSLQFNINLSNQPNGVYFIKVIGEDGSSIGEGKIIVQK